jgi:myo-inositol-1(or 4)-monophosphatase
MSQIIEVAVESAIAAGKLLARNFGNIAEIESKGDRNLVTNVDKAAERIIIEKIRETFPAHGIIGEESGMSVSDNRYLWIIDPLDGTHNFIRDINIFGVSIGVLCDGEFVAGVIYMPKDDELYVSEKGSGAFKNGNRIRVSKTDNLKECSLSFDSSLRYQPDTMLKVLGELSMESFNVRMFGSSVRVLSYVAEGVLDYSVEFFDQPWDFAGGVCIIEEAGGKITALKGEKLTHKHVGYIASNAVIHEKVQGIVNKHLLK